MRRHAPRRAGLWAPLLCLLLILAGPSAAADTALVRGRALGPGGAPVAGVLISDEVGVTQSGADGSFALATRPGRVVWAAAPAGMGTTGPWWWPAAKTLGRDLEIRLHADPRPPTAPLALIGDPHLFSPSARPRPRQGERLRLELPMRVWRREAARLADLAPALTLVCGDLAADADHGDEAHAGAQLDLAAAAMALLPTPARALPGNHDARYPRPGGPGEVDLSLWRARLGPARQAYRLAGATVVLLDNLDRCERLGRERRLTSCGGLSDQALTWLARLLETIPPERPLIIASHYPLLSPLSGANPLHRRALVRSRRDKGAGLRDADQAAMAVWRLLRGRRVLALVAAHQHAAWESRLLTTAGEVWFLGLPALCGGWWKGPRDLGPLRFAPGYVLLHTTPSPRAELVPITW